jgi:regulator of sirC expression with transglutaminase-like and TPR domain
VTNLVSADFIRRFTEVAKAPSPDLAPAALAIARIEYPQLDASRYLRALDRMGAAAADRLAALGEDADLLRRIAGISSYLFKEQGFAGNRKHYDDPRNSFLNNVIDRRTGIPITLALVYIEVSRRAGLRIDGVNFPGHFLLRVHPDHPEAAAGDREQLIVDPFHGGTILSELDCRKLLRSHAGDEVPFDRRMLARATKAEIIVRMLVNLKRIYVRMRSFPQAHATTELLLALDPAATTELRDRGLLAYHLNDYPAALRDLEAYLRFSSRGTAGDAGEDDAGSGDDEHKEIWEHVKALRRRVANLN